MACTGLKCFTVMHQGLDGVSSLSTCKFLFVCLLTFYNRNCQNLFAEICINIQHLNGTCLSLFSCCVSCMALLPQELSGTNLFLIEIAEQSLGSRTHAKSLLKRIKTAMSHPCNLRGKTFYMIFLFIKKRLRDKDRHINILYTGLFKTTVKLFLNVLPDRITCRFDDHASSDAGIIG